MFAKKIIIGIKLFSGILITISVIAIIYNSSENKYYKKIENKKISNFFNYVEIENEKYIAIIEIPKINLKAGLVEKTSKNNTVEKNIQILKESSMPNKENTYLFLAAHSGSSNISYFKNIYKLNNKDKINIYYKNIKYTYIVNNKYKDNKTGIINIPKQTKTSLILTTCGKENNKQLIIISDLESKTKY